MDVMGLIALLISLSAFFMYINYRYLKLPETIGIMILSLFCSLILIFIKATGISDFESIIKIVQDIDFEKTLMNGMLSFLLFAGALHVNINDLAKQKWIILVLATIGVVSSTLLVGSITYIILTYFNIFNSSYSLLIYCMLFGSLISPTDPISVLGILKEAKAPKTLETKITGESLFNDGVGVVVFMVIAQMLPSASHNSHGDISPIGLFAQEAIGGIIFGFIIGWIFYRLLKSVDNYSLEILLTLSLVSGGYYIAGLLHISGPIAMVVAGLLIGNQGKMFAMSEITHKQLFSFWELIDEFLNAVLFLLMGMVIISFSFDIAAIVLGIALIGIVLFIRYLCITSTIEIFRIRRSFTKGANFIMTWGGLRGGISVAMALSLPNSEYRDIFILVTYIIVLFSIIVQGLTVKPLIKYFLKDES
jgi:CPA1 family monovalent cation:H+ antiporter